MKCIDLKGQDLSGSNLSLVFYKCAPPLDKKDAKSKWFSQLSRTRPSISFINKILSETIFFIEQHLNMEVYPFKAATTQPLIIGLGEPSPYETGITLDFLTGLPIIPGSAVKGITRRAAIMLLSGNTDVLPYGEEFEELAKEYDQHEHIVEIFGTQDRKGKVIFMDAYPVSWENAPNGKLFRVDIMNPHYGPYYSTGGWDKKEGKPVPPADWYDPNPIFYLTVNERVTYRFILASRDKNLLDTAYKWLKFALENIGVGAKGNQGYGVFEVDAN